jgi:hypothetical protein
MNYAIYGKTKAMKQYRPLSGNTFCINLIHAELFETKQKAELCLQQLKEHNPNIQWKIKKLR